MNTFLNDLQYSFRVLSKNKCFTAVVILTLAVGIGANTAIFSLIDTVLLRPLAFHDPETLVRLYETESAPGKYPFAGPDFVDWRAQNSTFESMSLYSWAQDMNLSGGARPDHVYGVSTDANFFKLLGVRPVLGRTWMAGEDQPDKNTTVVLSHRLWQSRYAADPNVIGQTLELNSKKYTIVGVMPPDFRYPAAAQLWMPMDTSAKGLGQRGSHWACAIGRLKHGVAVAQARADLKLIAARLEQQYPDSNHKVGSVVVPLHDDLVGESRDALLMMLSTVGLVLLIACANVANLLLSKAVARLKETAVRSALGAARGRLIRQFLTESLTLSFLGGAVGLLLGWGLIEWFSRTKGAAVPQFAMVQLNPTVLLFTFGLAVMTGVLFGLVPALQASRPDIHEELRGGAGSLVSAGKRRRFTSNALVVGEIALALLLLVSAGLLLKDFARIRSTDIGVRTAGVWTGAVRLPESKFGKVEEQKAFLDRLLAEAARIPGVDSAALSNRMPLEGGSNGYIKLRGQATERMSGPLVENHSISPGYFRTMGVRVLQGRTFTAADVEASAILDARMHKMYDDGAKPSPEETNAVTYPTIVNEVMVRAFWPNRNPLGEMYSFGDDNGPWAQVIGVVNDVKEWGLVHKAVPEAYHALTAEGRAYLMLHTGMNPAALTPGVRQVLARLDSSLPLIRVRTMDQVVAENAQSKQFLSVLVGSFAGLSLLLAAIGIYGVLSYVVTQRTRDIGIRMTLGANRGQVLWEVLREGMLLAGLGLTIGLAGAMAAGRLLSSVLHEVKPGDPAVFVGTAGFLALVTFLACYLPARRAARMDPLIALRYE
jgi:putative ABC transport system permease protein